MSVTEGDVILKLSTVRDHALLSIHAVCAERGQYLDDSQTDRIRAILSRLALDTRSVVDWANANRITASYPAVKRDREATPFDEEDTQPTGASRKPPR